MGLFKFVLLFFLSCSADSWAQTKPNYTHKFSPQFIYLDETDWNEENVRAEVTKVQKIYDQCNILIEPLIITKVTPINHQTDMLGIYPLELVQFLNISHRPLVFFMQSATPSRANADDFAENSPMKDLTYTAWIGADIMTTEYKMYRDPNYNTVAHELAHLLCNCGHKPPGEKNLLAGLVEDVNGFISPSQCETFQNSSLVGKIN